MEKSLDQLIEHLLAEIAVCGPTGECVFPSTSPSSAYSCTLAVDRFESH